MSPVTACRFEISGDGSLPTGKGLHDTDEVSVPNFVKLKSFINSKITSENKFEIPDIKQEFGLNYLSKMQVGKATGLDGTECSIVACSCSCYSVFLDKGHQSEYQYWEFFGVLERSLRVCLVCKAGDRLSMDNYRPISILCILSKVIERHVHTSMYEYLIKHNLLSIHLSGFRPYHSCDITLIKLADSLVTNIDKGLISGLNSIDYRKAFDLVDHATL